jgi:hypothetical protein
VRFKTFLTEVYEPEPAAQGVSRATMTTQILSTSFYDGQHQLQPIQVEAELTYDGDRVVKVRPLRVKYNGKLVRYEQFLQAIPTQNNQALFNPDEHIDTWSAWIE